MHRIERKCDRTADTLVGFYNFRKEFLATDEEFTVISAFQLITTRLCF